MASVRAADDNCCQHLTLPSQPVGHVGAAWDNIKQDCLTPGERPVVRHSISRGQKGLPISRGHRAASICHSEAPSSPILLHMQTERHWKPLKAEVPHRANIAGGEQLLMRRVKASQSIMDLKRQSRSQKGTRKANIISLTSSQRGKGFFNRLSIVLIKTRNTLQRELHCWIENTSN